ncbi:MAG TPA: hypothetical protein VL095_14235 [Flavisolibacter sp.]|nr:hypothetical protein [Flavisolibacter sp.]
MAKFSEHGLRGFARMFSFFKKSVLIYPTHVIRVLKYGNAEGVA